MDIKTRKRLFAGPAAVLAILTAAQLACAVEIRGGITPPSIKISTADPGSLTPKAGETPAVAKTESAATPEAAAGGVSDGNFACFGTGMNGVTCLTAGGWKTYTRDNSEIKGSGIETLAACPDGKIYAGTSIEMAVFDGRAWESIPVGGEEYQGADFIACGPDGSIWTAYYEGVSKYKNGVWTSFSYEAYATGEYAKLAKGLAVAPDGTVWVGTGNSISAYDGAAWKEYKQGSGFDKTVSPAGLAVDSQNRVWTLDYDTLYRFENGVWEAIELGDSIYGAKSLVIDPEDRLWVNTSSQGALIFDGQKWVELSNRKGDIHSNGVNMAAFDASGRTWLAMAYGIDVLMDGAWTHFRMDNADLLNNEITAVAVAGDGPPLPAPLAKKPGSIVGSIIRGGAPLADAEVEFCVEAIILTYSGETPCSSQPFMKKTRTSAEGYFSIPEIPTGYYIITVKVDDGWISSSKRVPVEEGKQTDMGELKLEKD